MDQQQELESKRREVREEILALKETVPSARIFNQLGRAFKHNSLGYWLLNIILLLLFLLGPALLIALAFKETGKLIPIFNFVIFLAVIAVLGAVVPHIAVQFIFDDLANRIVDKINNTDDLSKLLLWIKKTWSTKNVLAFVLICSFSSLLPVTVIFSAFIHQFVGFGFSLFFILSILFVNMVWYGPIWASFLIIKLKEYQYDMNAFSPADSEILSDIFEMFMRSIYMLAGISAVVTLVSTSSLLDQQLRALTVFPALAASWGITIVQFLLTRSTLGAITNRAKWKTLNRIRTNINVIEATGDLSDKDTAERLFRLADIHKQIMASKTNTFDLKSVSTLFSQLMLPLLGLLLGNLDKILKLLSK